MSLAFPNTAQAVRSTRESVHMIIGLPHEDVGSRIMNARARQSRMAYERLDDWIWLPASGDPLGRFVTWIHTTANMWGGDSADDGERRLARRIGQVRAETIADRISLGDDAHLSDGELSAHTGPPTERLVAQLRDL